MNVLDLFSGIGGFSYGFERAGMRTVHFCEIDSFCRSILEKWWPTVPCSTDIRTFNGVPCDLICGGFPCQDASLARSPQGERLGIRGSRTGLWKEIKRLALDLRPRYLVMENVPGLLSAGFGTVLGDLAEIGYDAEWRCISASKAGLPHIRDRLWIVAYPNKPRLSGYIHQGTLLESVEKEVSKHSDKIASQWHTLERDFPHLRDDDGLSIGLHKKRIKALGNSIVPIIAEEIGQEIMRREAVND